MSTVQQIITISIVAVTTMLTRFLPFIVFPTNKQTPKFIKYISNILPYAVMGLLVVYSLKDALTISWPYALPEMISIAVIFVLHYWKRNMLISISAGTILYMVLIQLVFTV